MGLREERREAAREKLATRVERATAELQRVYESAQSAGLPDGALSDLDTALDRWDEFTTSYGKATPAGGQQPPLSAA